MSWEGASLIETVPISPLPGRIVTYMKTVNQRVFIATDDGMIHSFGIDGKSLGIYEGHKGGVWALETCENLLISGGVDKTIIIWDVEQRQRIRILEGHSSTVRCLRISKSKKIISGSRDGMLRVWDIETGSCDHILMGHTHTVRCIALQGNILASGSYDTTARIWDISTGECLRSFSLHRQKICCIAVVNSQVLTGDTDGVAMLWNSQNGERFAALRDHTTLVSNVARISSDKFITSSLDGIIHVYSVSRPNVVHKIHAHSSAVTSLNFQYPWIVSGGADGVVGVIDANTGCLIQTLVHGADAVWQVAFHEQRVLVALMRNGTAALEIWAAPVSKT